MSSLREQDQPIFRTRCIKRNITTSDTKRPQTSAHKKVYISNAYRFADQSQSETKLSKNNVTILQIKKETFHKNPTKPKLKNIGKFLTFCKQQSEREEKIKRVETGRKLSIRDHAKMEEFTATLMDSNSFFHTLQRTIVESVAVLSVRTNYEPGDKIRVPTDRIGFVLYGRAKLFNKNMKFILNRGDTIGQHGLFNIQEELKIRFIEPTSIIWLSFRKYNILKEQSITQGFRQQFNKLDTMLRMSLTKKKLHNV